MPASNNAVQRVSEWITTVGLYDPLVLSAEEAEDLAEAVSSGLKIDCYCTNCERHSVFGYQPSQKLAPRIPPSLSGRARSETSFGRALGYLPGNFSEIQFWCTRDYAHKLSVYLRVSGDAGEGAITLRKIGQWPSQFDLLSSDLQRYKRLLDEGDLRELKAAEICSSSGFHVAAFTYLRRVFERRLEVAHAVAKSDDGWNEERYQQTFFMEQKIDQLRDHLPTFLVENRKLYNILSAGIHELSESDCADGFHIARLGVTLILDEEIERRQREKSIAGAAKSLQQLQERYRKK